MMALAPHAQAFLELQEVFILVQVDPSSNQGLPSWIQVTLPLVQAIPSWNLASLALSQALPS